jgi:flagellar hook-associated protein 2
LQRGGTYIGVLEIHSIVGAITAQAQSRARGFLRAPRVSFPGPAGADGEPGRTPTASGLPLALLRVREAARGLVEAAGESAPAGVAVSSSRRAAVRVEAVAGSSRAGSATFAVEVHQLARAQVNEGAALSAAAVNGFHAGSNVFAVAVGGAAATSIAFLNDSTDTNAEALERLAAAINEADAGVSAAVVADEEAGTVRLDVSAAATGTRSAFTLTDVVGNAVTASAVGSIAAEATDAAFVVNGVARRSASNAVLIDAGRVRLTLAAETGPGTANDIGAVISVRPDAASAAVFELARSVNSLRTLLETEGSRGSLRLRGALDRALASRALDLEAIGVSIADGGDLKVVDSRLETAVATNPQAFRDRSGAPDGVGRELSTIAEQALGGVFALRLHEALWRGGGIAPGSLLDDIPGTLRGSLLDLFG